MADNEGVVEEGREVADNTAEAVEQHLATGLKRIYYVSTSCQPIHPLGKPTGLQDPGGPRGSYMLHIPDP